MNFRKLIMIIYLHLSVRTVVEGPSALRRIRRSKRHETDGSLIELEIV